MTLKDLITEIQSNPTLIKNHYATLTAYIETNNIDDLPTLMTPTHEHYLYMITEEKLKYFSKNHIDPQPLINITLQYNPLTPIGKNKKSSVIALMGIFFFPLKFDIIDYLSQKDDKEFNTVMNKFCYQTINNYDITESRRSELKRAMKLSTVLIPRMYKNLHLVDYLDTLNLLIQIVDIDSSIIDVLLSLMNTNVDKEWLIKLAETVVMLNSNTKLDIQEFLKISEYLKPMPSFSKLLLEKNYVNHKYFYNAINEDNITYSIKYFIKHISIVNSEVVLKFLSLYDTTYTLSNTNYTNNNYTSIDNTYTNNYTSIDNNYTLGNDKSIGNDNKNIGWEKKEEIFRFFIILAKSENNIEILNTVKLPNKITIQFLKNIPKEKYYLISNKDLFIESYLKIQNKDISILNNIPLLIKEEESKKLVLRVLEDYKLQKGDLENLLNFFYTENTKNINHLNTINNTNNNYSDINNLNNIGNINNYSDIGNINKEIGSINNINKEIDKIKEGGLEELIIKTLKKLEIPLSLKINRSNIKLYYYYIRDKEDIDLNLINNFYEYLLNTNDLFMCFEILGQIIKKDLNTKVFEYILSIISKLNLEDLINLIELSRKLDFGDIFLINISDRLIYLSKITKDYELLEKTLNKYLSINKNNNSLINLLEIDEYNIFKKILNLLKTKDLKELDLNRIVYFLLIKYSNPEFYDLQHYVIGILLKIMKISYSPFLVYQPEESMIHSQVQSLSEKRGRVLIKNFLNKIKGGKISEFGSKGKVDQQYLFQKGRRDNQDVDLSTFL